MKILTISVIFILDLVAQPIWVDNPSNNNFIGGVGIVENKTQRRLAIMKARATLLESIKVQISSQSEFNKSNEDGYNSSFSQKIIQEAKGYLNNSFVKDSFVDSEGYFYIWVVINKKF